MSNSAPGLPKLPLQLNAMQVLGLRDPDEGDWARLRVLQFAGLSKHMLSRMLLQFCTGIMVIALYYDSVSPIVLGGWAAALIVALWKISRLQGILLENDGRAMSKRGFASYSYGIIAISCLWSFALLVFAPTGSDTEHFALWGMIVMLFCGVCLTSLVVPLVPILFSLIVGVAAASSFLLTDHMAMPLAIFIFITVMIVGILELARIHLTAEIAEVGAVEKDEVVSLLLREFEENEADWLWQVDINRCIRSASPRFAFALGRDSKAVEGKSFMQMIAGENFLAGDATENHYELSEYLKQRESFSNIMVQVHLPSGRRWWELSGTPMHDEHDSFIGFRGVGSDVTEQRDRDDKIAYLARYDTLTGLPNRLMLTEALAEGIAYAEKWKTKCAFLMIDLDRFKSVNDSLGHQVGDRLLAQVSSRLSGVMSQNEQCGRLGGDEFAVVVRDAGKVGEVERVATAIITALGQPYKVDNHLLYIGASVGSAFAPRDGNSVETLMRNADLALYQAKDEGGNMHFGYVPSLHADAEERRKLEVSLRKAISRGELHLNYQPVVDAQSEDVVSFEALLRWKNEEHGSVSPGKFIPLAEDTRLIVPIGNWVLREACNEAARWPNHIRVAVNVSGEQLLEPGFAQEVVGALADSGLPAQRLEIEVTESVFLRDGRMARQTLEEIVALGCSIALDDFGTGYSSLGYLKNLSFSTIKIDRSFVEGASQNNRESLAIINAVIAMSKSLEMTTTAEGVEDHEQVKMVRKLGCSKIQGFFYGRPMPAVEARAIMGNSRAVA